jgi:hypothetical protein
MFCPGIEGLSLSDAVSWRIKVARDFTKTMSTLSRTTVCISIVCGGKPVRDAASDPAASDAFFFLR